MGELLNLVGLTTGIVLYAMLLAMVVRRPERPTTLDVHDRLPLVTAILGLTWNCCALLIYALQNIGVHGPISYLSVIGVSALGFLPAAVVHSVLRSGNDGIRNATKTMLAGTAYSASTLAAILHVRSLWFGGPLPIAFGLRLLTYVFVALVLPVAFVARRQRGARRALWIAALVAFAVSAMHLAQLHTGDHPWPVELLGHHASLPLVLAILYQDYPFAFADLFLKRALTLMALVTAAFGGIAMLGLASPAPGTAVSVRSGDVGLIVTMWVATALLYPWLRRGITRFVDTIVLGRPDYRMLRAVVMRQAQEHDRIGQLLDAMCELLTPALSATSMRWHELIDAGVRQDPESTSVVHIAHMSATTIIQTTDMPRYAIVSGRLRGGRRLLSDDVLMLEALAVIIARRIDAIRLIDERHERELREQEIQKLATEAELRALRAQINPHFLFNALTTIGYLIEAAPHRAFDTLMRLTVLLRSAFRSEGDFTTLGHELNLVEAYLDIERARFEDRLQVRIDVPAALRQARIPPLLLQPLVENAVKHGVAPKRFGGQVTVRARLEQGGGDAYVLAVVVHDTGSGISDAMLQHGRAHGTGLRNIERRLECLYGQAGCLLFNSSEDNGTTVEIRLPVAAWVEEEAVELGG